MTVTEQSVMLSCYPSGEILSARQKADNRLKGDVYESKAFRSEALPVTGFLRVLKTLEFQKSDFKALKELEIDFGP